MFRTEAASVLLLWNDSCLHFRTFGILNKDHDEQQNHKYYE